MSGVPGSWEYLMLAGAFGTCVAQATWRRDPFWAVAFGTAFLLSAECGGLPASFVAWALVAWGAGTALLLLAMLSNALNISLALMLGLAGTTALLASPASASIERVSLHRPPATAVAVEAMLRMLVTAP